MTLEIYYKDSRKMSEVNDRMIQTIITSPPYWNIKKYSEKKIDSEIGYGQTYEEYLEALREVWIESRRVLRDNGTLWINIGNKFNGGHFYPIAYDILSQVKELGFNLRNIIVWYKPNALPIHSNDNLTNKYEEILFFSKTDSYKFYKDRIRVPQIYFGKDWGGRDYKMNPKGKDPGNVWKYSPRKGNLSPKLGHPAPFPKFIPERVIRVTTDANDWVLDPFLGSGTTLEVCKQMDRSGIGYEINPVFKDLIEAKLGLKTKSLMDFPIHRPSETARISEATSPSTH